MKAQEAIRLTLEAVGKTAEIQTIVAQIISDATDQLDPKVKSVFPGSINIKSQKYLEHLGYTVTYDSGGDLTTVSWLEAL